MSGGVDSSVTAYLLQQQGWDCIGVTMKLLSGEVIPPTDARPCCTLDDAMDAKDVCRRMGIPHYVFNFTEDFQQKVIDKFVCTYLSGGTPNPCIDCNRYLKFDRLLQRARELGCTHLATGHYARILQDEDGRYCVAKGLDPARDQSYVLYSLTQDQLAHTLFPLGELPKSEVRHIAAENGFGNAAKKDSQDICFVPDGDYCAFLERELGKPFPPGDLIDQAGHVLGQHHGAVGYTIGQRRGLGVAAGARIYVLGKDMEKNTVTLGPESALFSRGCRCTDWNWMMLPPARPFAAAAKTRYRMKEQPVQVSLEGEDVVLTFLEPQRAVTPGQAAVLYQGDRVLGGGTIAEVIP